MPDHDHKWVLVRMQQVGEPMYTKDGKGFVHVRHPWYREDTPSALIGLDDIVGDEDGQVRLCRCPMSSP